MTETSLYTIAERINRDDIGLLDGLREARDSGNPATVAGLIAALDEQRKEAERQRDAAQARVRELEAQVEHLTRAYSKELVR